MVWPLYKESGASPEKLREVVERLKPLSIASLVQAYEAAMDEAKREGIAARARGTTRSAPLLASLRGRGAATPLPHVPALARVNRAHGRGTRRSSPGGHLGWAP